MTNYLDLELSEINKLLKEKKIKPVDLVNEAFARIEKNKLNDFITLNDHALEEAKKLENLEVDNILFGIPIAIKDNIVTKGLRTTCASKILENFDPVYNATVIDKIKEKHMIIIGKTNMDEFAMGSTGETSYFGNTLNPRNKTRVPGGSSSGSAAAVASHEVVLALGSDTGGSVRQPSGFCGLVGLKPTYGRVSRYGLVAFASSLDQIGPMSKNVYENAVLLNAISGLDERDLNSVECDKDFTSLIGKDVKGLKIAVPNYYMSDVIDSEVRNKITEVLKVLKNKGCQVDYIDIPNLEYAIPLYQVIALGEASTNLARFDGIKYGFLSEQEKLEDMYTYTRSIGFGPEVKRRIMVGSYVLSGENAKTYYFKALKLRHNIVENFKKVFKDYDLILGPTNTNVAYPFNRHLDNVLQSFYDDLLTIPVSMAGLPALAMPVGFNHEKLPIGLQIIGDYFKEEVIYELASFLEKELALDLRIGSDN